MFYGRVKGGLADYSIKASFIEGLKKSKLAVFFIHGGDDDFLATSMLEECYRAQPGKKEYLLVEGAGHGLSFFKELELYYSTIDKF